MKPLVRFVVAVVTALTVLWVTVGVIRAGHVVETTIINETDRALEAVPLATIAGLDIVGTPPLASARFTIIALPRYDTSYRIEPNSETPLLYEFADTNLCWLLVRASPESAWKVVPNDLTKTAACALPASDERACCGPVREPFVVKALDELEVAPPWLTCAIGGTC
ncbi:MAG: hypothetical protein ACO1OB_20105 [Archangium sp.]